MGDNILQTIKKLINIDIAYDHFDQDVLVNINAAIAILLQLGVEPVVGAPVFVEAGTTWGQMFSDKDLALIISYTHQKARLVFDPPQHGALLEALRAQITELEFRIQVATSKTVLPVEGSV